MTGKDEYLITAQLPVSLRFSYRLFTDTRSFSKI